MKTISRRNFVRTTTGALASLASFSCSKRRSSGSPGCFIGYGTYGLPAYSIEDAIQLVSRIGYDSIELACMPGYHGDPDTLSKEKRKTIRSLLADYGLNLGALMGLPKPSNDNLNKLKELDYLKKMIELSHDLSIDSPPLIQGVLGGENWIQVKKLFRDRLGEWVGLAKQANVTLAIKPHRGHAMSLPGDGAWIIQELGQPIHLRLVYDYSHYAYRGHSIEKTVETAFPYTAYIVLKDAIERNGKVDFALPGTTNTIDHAKTLRLFYEYGYRGEVCCEVSSQVWREEGFDPVQASRTCYQNLDQFFSTANIQRKV